MTEFDFVRDDEGGYDTEFVNSITFSHDIVGKLSGDLEFFTVTGKAPGFDWQGQMDVGFTYVLSDDAVLDFGCNFGVTEASPDFNHSSFLHPFLNHYATQPAPSQRRARVPHCNCARSLRIATRRRAEVLSLQNHDHRRHGE